MITSRPSFAIIGSGGVGGYFGARLARAGFDNVTAITTLMLSAERPFSCAALPYFPFRTPRVHSARTADAAADRRPDP
jgi:Ketopantoate reductase PanE/ApbA